MSEQPPQSWLERLLAAEAERAIPDDLNLWPGTSQRLRERGPKATAPFTANGAVDAHDLGTMHDERRAVPFAARIRQRSGELIGAAITFGLAALVITVFAFISGWPEEHKGPLGLGNDVPQQVIPAGSTPAPAESAMSDGKGPGPTSTPRSGDSALKEIMPVLVAGPDCTFDLDVSLESGTDHVLVKVRARSNWACADTGTLRLTVIDAAGERAEIVGNPLTLPLTAVGRERRAAATVVWSNWCGERARFQVETSFGDEQRMHALPEAPRCVGQNRPSTLRMTTNGAASATPKVPAAQSTPIPKPVHTGMIVS